MKQLVIFFFILVLSQTVSAQLTDDDHKKYWHYRERLVTYFMHVGPGQGESIPAGIRNFMNWDTGKPSILHWGDATLYLGWYLGVLATEHHLLKMNNQSTHEILRELNYAVQAVERLDSVAEVRWNKDPQINGFLIRDDVPEDFILKHPHLNKNVSPDTGYIKNSGTPVEVNIVRSDYTSSKHAAFSQDQLVHLLMGLALVVKFAPEDDLLSKPVVNIKSKARNLIYKMTEYASNTSGNEPWQLRYPDGTVIPNRNGGDLRANATGIAQIGKKFSGNSKSFLAAVPFNIVWQMQQAIKGLRKNVSSLHMALVTAAVSDYWRSITGENTTEQGINYQGSYRSGNYLWINYNENNYGWDIFYNYLRVALHDHPAKKYSASINIIKSAPFNGPYYHLNNELPSDGWAASRRFIDTPPRQAEGSIHFPGNYNGLDFMLFFNLYHIADADADVNKYLKTIYFNFE